MPAMFNLKINDGRRYQFDYFDSKKEKLMESAEFESKSDAEQAIQEVRVGSMMSEMISVGTSAAGEKYFIIKNSSGKALVKSASFSSEMVFNNALHSVRDNACIAEILDTCN